MKESLLAIDCGTQSLRAHLFDAEGRLLASEKRCYAPYESPKPGWAEQDAMLFWDNLCKACLSLKEKAPEEFLRIAGMGITTQRATMICLDRMGNPLRPAITWLDQRKASPVWQAGLLSPFLHLAGASRLVYKAQTDAKCNWIAQNQPGLWKKTACYMQVSGFLNHRLTGNFSDSTASQIGHLPFDYKKQAWSGPLSLSRRLFPVPEKKLPELFPPGAVLGRVTASASRATGIREGVPVIACGSDKGCETLGAGVFQPGMASLSFGTTATVQTTTKDYFEPLRFMPAYPAPIPGYYNAEVEIFRGYWMITWFKNEFGHPETQEALACQLPVEMLLDRLLAETPPGAMGLVLQPFWSPGLHHPDAKGSLIGFGDVHTRAHVYRAVIEGLAYGLLDGLHSIEKRGKIPIHTLAVSGGASQSDAVCQISADIFNRPMVRGETCETSGLGAALVTAVGLGLHPDVTTALSRMVRVQQRFVPDADNVRLYHRLYTEVYQRMYKALAPLYRKIRDITGYPESR
ncbi:sugar (pentulose or hexulose) kinase [Desulfobotulus alkaliphilus]|uniref:Sugar (Pentulose or hexulose) kinase n=1 Tax=Desulfobotulus alkaliphilus TaxID=622671 RepID=A0A562RT87_9BACT|nr:FGGY-family carbohydrate kinase [Desulfobotulus alkaliphilus]TWI72289.1 sugar (pentulose or hexulose) kinase [Desulfobotulus alkaliphilus]